MLGSIDALPARFDGDAFPVPNAGDVALSRRELLSRALRVVPPDATPGPKLGARTMAGGQGGPILDLARVRGRSQIDIQSAAGVDAERMHRVVAGEREALNDDLR